MVAQHTAPRRRGRPPATDSAITRARIFDAARRLFAERGYSAVTNKDLAAEAGLTTGALYHYIESKLDLYVEVYADVQVLIYQRFQDAIDGADSFVGKLEAVFDAANDLTREDPSMARLIGSVRSDAKRHKEVRERLAAVVESRERFFFALVDVGVETGEIAECDRALAWEFIRLLLVGVTEGTANSLEQQEMAIAAIKAMLRGRLIRPVVSAERE